MPKQLLYVNGFPKGSYGNASANDIPEGYGVYIENADPKYADRLVPTRKSAAKANAATLDGEVIQATNFDGNTIWGWKESDRKLKYYNPDTDATTDPSLVTPSGSTLASINRINRELYLPLYDTSSKLATEAYWAGLIASGQFGAAAPASYVLEPAKCNPYYYAGFSRFPYAACYFNYDAGTPANSRVSNSTTSDVFGCITPPDDLDFSNATEDGFFQAQTTYYWAISFVYDGYQESPLLKYAYMNNVVNAPYWFSAGSGRTSNFSSVLVRMHINIGASALSKRITGINLYRAQAPGIIARWDVNYRGLQPATQYRFVQSFSIRTGYMSPQIVQSGGSATAQTSILFPINDLGASTSTHSYTLNSGTAYRIDFVDTGFEGASYEENTGVFDTLEQNWINYRLSTFANGYHFVAQCAGAPALLGGESKNFLFRSAPNAPAVFNIAKDFLKLPDTPTAILAWNGRLFVFTETRFIRINPEAMFIEEELLGFGAAGEGSSSTVAGISRLVAATPYGIFFADLNNIYRYDGQRILTIGDPILRQSYDALDIGWLGSNPTRRRQSKMVFDPTSQRVIIFLKSHSGADTQQYYLSYDPVRDRWDYGKPSGSPWTVGWVKDADFDANGNLWVSLSGSDTWSSDADVLHQMFAGNDEAVTVITPAYDFGSLKQQKWFYDVVCKNAGPAGTALDIDYRVEENGAYTSPSVTTSGVLSSVDLNKTSGRVLQLKIVVPEAASPGQGRNSLDDFTIQFRKRITQE